jgi:hypothetical protein
LPAAFVRGAFGLTAYGSSGDLPLFLDQRKLFSFSCSSRIP